MEDEKSLVTPVIYSGNAATLRNENAIKVVSLRVAALLIGFSFRA
jgi:hypothetical protein